MRAPMLTLMLLGLLTLLPSCGARVGCEAWRPILAAETDTPETLRQVLAHNLTGRQLCGW